MLYSKIHLGVTRLLSAARMIARFSKTLYTVFLQARIFSFAFSVVLNFLGRVFNLAAFVISIQAIYIAFQSSASHGDDFKGKRYFEMLGLSDAWLPWLLAFLVMSVFLMPSLLKILETRLIGNITKENHNFCLEQKVSLKTDLFVTVRSAPLLTTLCRFFSGALFILISLVIVALFRFDLFLLVLLISLMIAFIVISSNWRQIMRTAEQSPKQLEYITAARQDFNPEADLPLEDVPTFATQTREIHFSTILGNWTRMSRAALYQVGLMGFATATIVLFVFSLEDLDQSMLVLLLYLVIAIRYAMNTARETGLMASRILDFRTEHVALGELQKARRNSFA